MRISELARQAGLPLATVKYYLREGLLHPGRRISATQAEYDESHLSRLRLLRLLREIGQVPVNQLRDLVAVTENPALSIHQVLGAAACAIGPTPPPPGPLREQARAAADALIRQAGWTGVADDAPDRENLAGVLETMLATGILPDDPESLRPYLMAADTVGRFEIEHLKDEDDPAAIMRQMVVGQVLFGRLLTVLRRLAEEHYSFLRFGTTDEHGRPTCRPPQHGPGRADP